MNNIYHYNEIHLHNENTNESICLTNVEILEEIEYIKLITPWDVDTRQEITQKHKSLWVDSQCIGIIHKDFYVRIKNEDWKITNLAKNDIYCILEKQSNKEWLELLE